MESKDYFEMTYASHCEQMRSQIAEADLIYIDSCSLMDPCMPLLAEHIIPILEQQKKKLTIIENVLNELNTLMRTTHNPKKLSREIYAYTGLYTLRMFTENDALRGFGILDFQRVPDDIKGNHADAAFETVLGMKSISNRVLMITQDKSLTEALLKLNESGATSRIPIKVYKISDTGDMKGFLSPVKKSAPDVKVRQQKPKQQQKTQQKPQTPPPPKPQKPVVRAVAKTPVYSSAEQLRTQEALKYMKDTVLHVPPEYKAISKVQIPSMTAAYIPNTVTVIMPQAFIGCTNLTRVALPDSLISIEESAFQKCSSLHSVTIPHSVVRIDSAAFKDCTALSSIILGHGLCELGSSVFANCVSLTDITIPAGVPRIETMAFKGCRALQNVHLSEGLEAIAASAFCNCTSLVSLTIPSSVTEIATTAFTACPSLILYVYRDSYAHKFVQERGLKHKVI